MAFVNVSGHDRDNWIIGARDEGEINMASEHFRSLQIHEFLWNPNNQNQ